MFIFSEQGRKGAFLAPDEGIPTGGAAPTTTPSQPIQSVPSGQATQQPTGTQEGFTNIDPNTLAPELQGFYKSMQADYTRKTQAVAPLQKLAEQYGGVDKINEALGFYSQISQMSPEQMFGALIQQVGPQAAMQYMSQAYGQQPQAPQEPQTVDDLVSLIENRLMPKIQPIQQEFESQRKEALVSKALSNIKQILQEHPESGINEDQIWQAAAKGRYGPEQMFSAFVDAMGGHQKYQEYRDKAAVQSYLNKAKDNAQSTSTVLSNGTPAQPAAEVPKNFRDAKDRALAMARQLNKS